MPALVGGTGVGCTLRWTTNNKPLATWMCLVKNYLMPAAVLVLYRWCSHLRLREQWLGTRTDDVITLENNDWGHRYDWVMCDQWLCDYITWSDGSTLLTEGRNTTRSNVYLPCLSLHVITEHRNHQTVMQADFCLMYLWWYNKGFILDLCVCSKRQTCICERTFLEHSLPAVVLFHATRTPVFSQNIEVDTGRETVRLAIHQDVIQLMKRIPTHSGEISRLLVSCDICKWDTSPCGNGA